jgi:hypothetical protein
MLDGRENPGRHGLSMIQPTTGIIASAITMRKHLRLIDARFRMILFLN